MDRLVTNTVVQVVTGDALSLSGVSSQSLMSNEGFNLKEQHLLHEQ